MGEPEAKRFLLRLPIDLRQAIEKRAETNGRSLNAEILAMLSQVISGDSLTKTQPMLIQQERAPYSAGYEEMLMRLFKDLPVEK